MLIASVALSLAAWVGAVAAVMLLTFAQDSERFYIWGP